jgi:hypothetical protein
MTKLIVAFRSFANAPKELSSYLTVNTVAITKLLQSSKIFSYNNMPTVLIFFNLHLTWGKPFVSIKYKNGTRYGSTANGD